MKKILFLSLILGVLSPLVSFAQSSSNPIPNECKRSSTRSYNNYITRIGRQYAKYTSQIAKLERDKTRSVEREKALKKKWLFLALGGKMNWAVYFSKSEEEESKQDARRAQIQGKIDEILVLREQILSDLNSSVCEFREIIAYCESLGIQIVGVNQYVRNSSDFICE